MIDIKFYRFWIVMNFNNICLMIFLILTRISDDYMPIAAIFIIMSAFSLIYSSVLRRRFDEIDYAIERHWKKYLISRNLSAMNILILLLVATSFVLIAIFVGRAMEISEFSSIIIGLFSCFILQSVRDIRFLVEHGRKPKSQFPPLDHSFH